MKNTPKYKPENGALKTKLPVRNPREDYECWYFECVYDDEDLLRIYFMINDSFSLPVTYGVKVEFIGKQNHSVISESFASDEVELSTEKCNHKFGNNRILDLGDHFELNVEINATTIQLKYYPELEGFNNKEDNIVNQNILGTKFIAWNSPIPRANVTGFIDQEGKRNTVQGVGYHDHVWSNTAQYKDIKYLYLGKIFENEFSIFYTLLFDDKESVFTKLIVAHNDKILLTQEGSSFDKNIVITAKDHIALEQTEKNIPANINFTHEKFELDIALKDITQQKLKEKHRLGGIGSLAFKGEEYFTYKVEGNKDISFNAKSIHDVLIF
ncbi:MAG: hypothetical protein KQH79_03990 [Bacteroidetes bacterium]|nr:hypothetical protein [Bacteroidota bacterium]